MKVKFIKEQEVVLVGDTDEVMKGVSYSQTIYECGKCHFTFVGDCKRCGHGYDSESVQTPNFCLMCGEPIEDVEKSSLS